MLTRIRDAGDVSYQRFSAAAELQRLVENDLAVLLSERFERAPARDGAADGVSLAEAVPVPATPRFVALGSVRAAELVTAEIAAALGLSTSGGALITDLKSLISRWCSRGGSCRGWRQQELAARPRRVRQAAV